MIWTCFQEIQHTLTHTHVLNTKLSLQARIVSYGVPYASFYCGVDSVCDLVILDVDRLICEIDGPSSLSEILGMQWIDGALDE